MLADALCDAGEVEGGLAEIAFQNKETNARLVSLSDDRVAFRWKDYRHHGKAKTMVLTADEFIRRFLLHTLPDGFHRIRHYGFLANGHRAAKLALCRRLLTMPAPEPATEQAEDTALPCRSVLCPCCGGAMITIGVLPSMTPPQSPFRMDSS